MNTFLNFVNKKTIVAGLFVSLSLMVGRTFCHAEDQPAAKSDAAATATDQKLEPIKLLQPDFEKNIPLMQALRDRKSTRDFADKKLSEKHLSELLWSANGMNRDNGKRTSPAAMNKQAVDIYVVMQEGIYLYDAPENQLTGVAKGDYRKDTGRQAFVTVAAVTLVFVADLDKFDSPSAKNKMPDEEKTKNALLAVGCQMQNVGLYCASEGLGAVVRGYVDQNSFGKLINARPTQKVLCAETVGYPK
jgi:nitroreductase